MNACNLGNATLEQKIRVFAAEHLGIGPWCTRLAVWAEISEASGKQDEGPLAKVAPMELLKLNARLEAAEPPERYAILAEPIPEKVQMAGEPVVWFDVIRGLTAPHIIQSVGQAACELLPTNKRLWGNALDLGTGTGNLAAVLLGKTEVPRSVQNLTAVDRESSLSAIAQRRYPEASYVCSDATALPFADASFDLIVSGGLAYSVDQTKFFTEVSRLLTPGGAYLDGDYRDRFLHPDTTMVGPKHHLESMIVSQVAPLEIAPTRSWGEEDFAQVGLRYATREYRGELPGAITDVRILRKPE